jgi:hypothetical protein
LQQTGAWLGLGELWARNGSPRNATSDGPRACLCDAADQVHGLQRAVRRVGSTHGTYQPTLQTGWETLKLLANGIEPRNGKEGAEGNRQQVQRIDLRWHDLRREGACRLLADGVDIRIIQLMLGHASIQQTQCYLT